MRGESGHEGFVLFVRTDQAKGLFWIQKLWEVGKKEGNSSSPSSTTLPRSHSA